MNKMKILFLALVVLFSINVSAQDKNGGRLTPELFRAKLEQYIAKKACLTPAESSRFFPLYGEMMKKQHAVHTEIKKLKRIKPVTDAECKKNIIRCDECEIEMKKIQKEYHEKFMQILPAQKVYDVLKAEDRFHRQMFKRTAGKFRKRR